MQELHHILVHFFWGHFDYGTGLTIRSIYGQRTEQVKTGQVNPDRPLVGPSVDTFVGCFVGSP